MPIYSLELTEKDAARIGEDMQTMPAYADVEKGLVALKETLGTFGHTYELAAY